MSEFSNVKKYVCLIFIVMNLNIAQSAALLHGGSQGRWVGLSPLGGPDKLIRQETLSPPLRRRRPRSSSLYLSKEQSRLRRRRPAFCFGLLGGGGRVEDGKCRALQ